MGIILKLVDVLCNSDVILAQLGDISKKFSVRIRLNDRALPDHRLGNDQLPHHVYQIIQLPCIHSDGSRIDYLTCLFSQCLRYLFGSCFTFGNQYFTDLFVG